MLQCHISVGTDLLARFIPSPTHFHVQPYPHPPTHTPVHSWLIEGTLSYHVLTMVLELGEIPFNPHNHSPSKSMFASETASDGNSDQWGATYIFFSKHFFLSDWDDSQKVLYLTNRQVWLHFCAQMGVLL